AYQHTGLAAGSTHYYRVRAVNGSEQSAYTAVASATTTVIPAAPTNLVATAQSQNAIALSWQHNSANTTGFRIQRSTNASSGFAPVATTGSGVTTYTDNTGLSANTTYYYRVAAMNGNEASANATASAKTLANTSL